MTLAGIIQTVESINGEDWYNVSICIPRGTYSIFILGETEANPEAELKLDSIRSGDECNTRISPTVMSHHPPFFPTPMMGKSLA